MAVLAGAAVVVAAVGRGEPQGEAGTVSSVEGFPASSSSSVAYRSQYYLTSVSCYRGWWSLPAGGGAAPWEAALW